jgi:hypothetical protein
VVQSHLPAIESTADTFPLKASTPPLRVDFCVVRCPAPAGGNPHGATVPILRATVPERKIQEDEGGDGLAHSGNDAPTM